MRTVCQEKWLEKIQAVPLTACDTAELSLAKPKRSARFTKTLHNTTKIQRNPLLLTTPPSPAKTKDLILGLEKRDFREELFVRPRKQSEGRGREGRE